MFFHIFFYHMYADEKFNWEPNEVDILTQTLLELLTHIGIGIVGVVSSELTHLHRTQLW